MKKKLLLSLLAFCQSFYIIAQIDELKQPDSVCTATIGMPVPYFKLLSVESQNLLMYEPTDLCGKAYIIEVWRSTNKSSKTIVSHYENLKKHFGEKIQVLLVSDESLETVQDFVNKNRSILSFAIDPSHKIDKMFRHTTTPHSTLIDTDGYVRAITYPEEITFETIDKILNNQAIALKTKSELLPGQDAFFLTKNPDEPIYQCTIKPFDADKKINYEWKSEHEFSFTNYAIAPLYQILYDVSPARVINKSKQADWYKTNHNSFVSFDLKMPNLSKNAMMMVAIQHLNNALPIKSKLELIERKGYLLERIITNENAEPNAEISQKSNLIGSHLQVNGLTVRTLRNFIRIIEDYELVDAPIKNDTDYFMDTPISIEALPTNKAELNAALKKYGFALIEKKIETEYLILYDEN